MHDMTHFPPSRIRGSVAEIGPRKPIHIQRNQQTILAGHVTEWRDAEGNPRWRAEPSGILFWSRGGAELFVKLGA